MKKNYFMAYKLNTINDFLRSAKHSSLVLECRKSKKGEMKSFTVSVLKQYKHPAGRYVVKINNVEAFNFYWLTHNTYADTLIENVGERPLDEKLFIINQAYQLAKKELKMIQKREENLARVQNSYFA